MEKVSFPPVNRKSIVLVSHRILKEEYNRTRNRVIGKAQFPTLLKKLWKTNAVEKTNIVKSFMKTGVFPLNSKAIDRSRVLKSSESTAPSSNTHSTNPFGNSSNNMSTTINPKDSTAGSSFDANARVVNSSTSTISRVTPRLTSSRQAVSYLDQVLEETMCSDDDNDSDASEGIDEASSDDENILYHYIPSQSVALKRKHAPPKEALVRKNRSPSPPAKRRSSEQQARRIIGFDTSDEEGDGSLIPLL